MWKLVDTALTDKPDRLNYWSKFVRSTYALCSVESPSVRDFRCRAEIYKINRIKIAIGTGNRHKIYRDYPYHDKDHEVFTININIAGQISVAQNNRQICLRPREFTLIDQDQNFLINHEGEYKMITLLIPHRMLLDNFGRPELFLAKLIDGGHGYAGIICRFFENLPSILNDIVPEEEPLIEESIITLLINLLRSKEPVSELTTTGIKHLERAKKNIEFHLHEPCLSRSDIADSVGLSVRELNRLFAFEGTSITRYLKLRRLNLAASCLRNSSFDTLTISEIAYKYGFSALSHFSNSFRTEFGCSPKRYRQSPSS